MGLDKSLRVQDFNSGVMDTRVAATRVPDTGAFSSTAAVQGAVTQLDEALGRLELVCVSSRDHSAGLRLEQEQRAEQHIQALKVQSDHWRGEAERQASLLTQFRARETGEHDRLDDLEADLAQWRQRAAHWQREAEKQAATLTQLNDHEDNARGKITGLETELAQWRHQASQWQEKAESWKEEARRSEEARVAALHRVGSADVKALASEVGASIDEAIAHIGAVLNRKKLKAEGQ